MSNRSYFTYKGREYNFQDLVSNWAKEQNELMPELGQIAVNFFQDRFKARAWTDKRAERWKPRKGKEKGRKRALMVKSGRLRNSINVKSFSLNEVVVATPVKYAAAHNFGFEKSVKVRAHTRRAFGRAKVSNLKNKRTRSVKFTSSTHQVKAHTRQMNLPKRQFMGNSYALSKKFDRAIFKRIDNTF